VLLDVPAKVVTAVLDAAEVARHTRLSADLQPLPPEWSLGQPLRVGDKVAFTGCDGLLRKELEQRAELLGVRIVNCVSSRTVLLVTDGSFSGGKTTDAAAHAIRCVHPEEFAILLRHLQPAVKKTTAAIPRPHSEAPATAPPSSIETVLPEASGNSVSPAVVRAWARANGYEVGDRGRLPFEVTNAYRRAQETLDNR
jgi:DNA polymerase-3 subunit epsilon